MVVRLIPDSGGVASKSGLRLIPDIYKAYAGPETGGFSMLPQSAVPGPEVSDDEVLGNGIPPSWLGASPNSAPASPLMAASTIAPKGGVPFQPTLEVDQAHETFRQYMKQKELGGTPEELRGPAKGDLGADYGVMGNLLASHGQAYADAVLGLPSDVADLATYPARFASRNPTPGPIVGRGSVPLQMKRGPETPIFGYAPRATVGQAGAGLAALNPDTTAADALSRYQLAEQQREARYPISSEIGNVTGGLQVIAQGRAPFSGALREHQMGLKKEIELAGKLKAGRSKIITDAAEADKRAMASPVWTKFRLGGEKVAESTLEGAGQGILQRRDPLESAAYTGGAQVGTGLATGALLHNYAKGIPYAGKAFSVAANLAILSGGLYVAGKILPGEVKDYESKETAAHKIIGSWLVGAATGAVSSRARSGWFSAKWPSFMDAAGSLPRNTMQKYLVQYMGSDASGRAEMEQTVKGLQDKLPLMTEAQQRDALASLGRGYNSLKTFLGKVGQPQ